MKLSKILASSCRKEILKTLASQIELPIMGLVHTVKGTYNEVNHNLNILEKEGIIVEHHAGHERVIELNYDNQKTRALLKALNILNLTNNLKRGPGRGRAEDRISPRKNNREYVKFLLNMLSTREK